MMEYCPNCGAKNTVRRVKTKLDFNFKNETITVDAEIYECSNCREQFDDAFESEKYVQEARRIYFEKHHLLKPEELKQFLDEYDLSYRDVEAITGIAFKTISRYVYGVIPDQSNSNLLKLLRDVPEAFLSLVEQTKDKIKKKKYVKLKSLLKGKIEQKFTHRCAECELLEQQTEEPMEEIQEIIESKVYPIGKTEESHWSIVK